MIAKTARNKKTRETVIQELLNSIKEDDNLEETYIDATADTITDPLEAIRLIQRYGEIMRIQNKRTIGYVVKQRQLLNIEMEQFIENVGQKKSKKKIIFPHL